MRRITHLPGRAWRLLGFGAWYVGQLVVTNIVVARHVITPRPRAVPGIVRVPLRSGRPGDMSMLTALVTLTPGTLVLEVERTPPALYVHGLDAGDPEVLRRQVQETESRMLAVLGTTP